MPHYDPRLSKREIVPVADADGQVLGSCTISKFTRQKGEAYNEILLFDTEDRLVAEIEGYRLHSRIRCGGQEGNARRIDTKDVIAAGRAALEHAADPAQMLAVLQEIAETLAEAWATEARSAAWPALTSGLLGAEFTRRFVLPDPGARRSFAEG